MCLSNGNITFKNESQSHSLIASKAVCLWMVAAGEGWIIYFVRKVKSLSISEVIFKVSNSLVFSNFLHSLGQCRRILCPRQLPPPFFFGKYIVCMWMDECMSSLIECGLIKQRIISHAPCLCDGTFPVYALILHYKIIHIFCNITKFWIPCSDRLSQQEVLGALH